MTLETERLRALLADSASAHNDIAARAKAAADKIAAGLAAAPVPEPAPPPPGPAPAPPPPGPEPGPLPGRRVLRKFFARTFYDSTEKNLPGVYANATGEPGKNTEASWPYIERIKGQYELARVKDLSAQCKRLSATACTYALNLTPGCRVNSPVTFSGGSPLLCNKPGHKIPAGRAVLFTTTGTLRTGLTALNAVYGVLPTSADAFNLFGPVAAYDGAAIYAIGDVRHHAGNVYTSLQAGNKAKTPQFSATWWKVTTTGTPLSASGTDTGAHTVRDLTTGHLGPYGWASLLPPDDISAVDGVLRAILTAVPEIKTLTPFIEPQNYPVPVDTLVAVFNRMCQFVRANHPGVKIGTPTIQPRDTVSQMLAVDYLYNAFFAKLTVHWPDEIHYHSYPAFSGGGNSVERAIARRTNMLVLIAKYPLLAGLPIKNVESSWGTNATAAANGTDRVAFASQYWLLHFAAGDEQACWWAPGPGFSWGTLYANGALLPEGVADLETYKWMIDAHMQGKAELVNGFRVAKLLRPNNYKAEIVWRPDGVASDYTVPAGMAFMRDLYGVSRAVTPGTTVQIGMKPILLESHKP